MPDQDGGDAFGVCGVRFLRHEPNRLGEIIDAIVTNKYINLKRFNLDFMQECVILHVLISKHNLNLLAEGLEYFTDTKQLHNLLTPYKDKQ